MVAPTAFSAAGPAPGDPSPESVVRGTRCCCLGSGPRCGLARGRSGQGIGREETLDGLTCDPALTVVVTLEHPRDRWLQICAMPDFRPLDGQNRFSGEGGQANASRGLHDSENGPSSNERSRRARTACRGPTLPVQTARIQDPVCHGPWSLMKGSGIGKFGSQAIETDRVAGGSIPSTHS